MRSLKVLKGKTRLEVAAPRAFCDSVKIGGSVSVNGVCLTVVKKTNGGILFELVGETKKRSTLGALRQKNAVNLERPLLWNGRLEGHFVLGHVDAVGRIKKISSAGKEKSFLVAFPGHLKRFILEKGCVAVDGVSLTVGRVLPGAFWVHLIPHTLKTTHFGSFKPGAAVNLEADILLKFFRTIR